jgi:hypothetical protein
MGPWSTFSCVLDGMPSRTCAVMAFLVGWMLLQLRNSSTAAMVLRSWRLQLSSRFTWRRYDD